MTGVLGGIRRNILPPLICDRCFLTIFISSILAPEVISILLIIFLFVRLIPSIGETIREDDPPDIKKTINCILLLFCNSLTTFLAAKVLWTFGIG